MARKQALLVVVVLAFAAVLALKPRPAARPGGTPAEQATAEAAAAGKPVLLSFRSNSCLPCRAMGETLAELRPKYQDRVAFVNVSLEPDTPDSALCERYQVRAKPTTVFLDRRGRAVATDVGAMPTATVAARLDELLR